MSHYDDVNNDLKYPLSHYDDVKNDPNIRIKCQIVVIIMILVLKIIMMI